MKVEDQVRHKRLGLGTVASIYPKNNAARVKFESGHVTTCSQSRLTLVPASSTPKEQSEPVKPKRRRRDSAIDYDMMDRAIKAISPEYPDADRVTPKYYGGRAYVEVWKDGSAQVVFYEGD